MSAVISILVAMQQLATPTSMVQREAERLGRMVEAVAAKLNFSWEMHPYYEMRHFDGGGCYGGMIDEELRSAFQNSYDDWSNIDEDLQAHLTQAVLELLVDPKPEPVDPPAQPDDDDTEDDDDDDDDDGFFYNSKASLWTY